MHRAHSLVCPSEKDCEVYRTVKLTEHVTYESDYYNVGVYERRLLLLVIFRHSSKSYYYIESCCCNRGNLYVEHVAKGILVAQVPTKACKQNV